MAEPTDTRSDISPEMSIPQASLESILCTEELHRRPSRPPDYEKENCALVKLVSALADSPSTIFQTLAETIQAITQCDSAGLSLLTRDGKKPDVCGTRFYWPAIAGMWNPHVGGGTPRNFGPCGDVLDQNRTLLFRHFERRYPYLMPVIPAAEECLLVPFYVAGQAVGTIWAIMHSDRRKFDAEDDRVMASLGKFASSAYQALVHIEDLKFQVAERENAEAAVRVLANGLEAKFRCLVDANIMGIFIWNLEGKIVEANEAFLRIVEYNREDLVSGCMRWTDLTPPEWRDRDERAVAELKALGSAKPYEKEYLQKGGNRVPVLVGGALFEEGGNEGVAFVLDLTERKQADEKLRRSEAYLTEAQRLSQTGSFGCNLSTGEMFWSEETFRIYGFDRSTQPAVERVLQRVHPEDKPLLQEHMDRASREGKACDVECRLLLPDDSVKHVRIVAHASKNESGVIQFIGAVMDVTATKQAEEKLRRSEAYLAEAQKLSHTGSFGWDVSSGEVFWSDETFRIFEYEPTAKVTIAQIVQRTHPEDRSAVQQLIDRVSRERTEFDFEHRLLMPDGSVKYLRVIGSPSENEDGCFEFVGAVTDITERKRAEQTLRESQASLQFALDTSEMGEWELDLAGRAAHRSLRHDRIFGYETLLPEWTYEKFMEHVLPEDRQLVDRKFRQAREAQSGWNFECRIVRSDQAIRWIRASGRPRLDAQGKLKYLAGIVQDITESKRAEEALRRSESYLAEAQRITHTGSWVWEVERRDAVHLSEEWYRIYGFDPAEGMPGYEKRLQRVHPEDRARWQETIERAIREKSDYEMEYRILLPDGTVKYIHVVGHPVLDSSGDLLQFVGCSTDITESKRAEEALRRSEQRWQTAFENSAIGMMMRDCSDRFIASNSVFQNMLGYTESELSQLSNEDVTYDEDRRANLGLIKELLEGRRQHFQIEKRYRHKDGTLLWVRNNVALIPGIADTAPFLFAVVEDITQRKQEESARRYSEERYRIVVETASDAVVSIDESSTILFVNPATSRIFGYDASELIGQPLTTLMPDYMRELHEAGFKRYLDTAERHMNWQGTELIALRKNSEEFPVEVSFGDLAINGRRLFTGFIRDITERKRAEEKIQQSEKELRQLLDFTPQHVTVLGPDGRRLYNNQAALDYHGLTLEEWQTADPDRLFHPQDWERITREVYSKFLSGSSLDIEVRLRRRDGQYRWFLIRYSPTLDEQGRPTHWYAAATDIEDRKQAEQRLQNENVALREEIDRASMFEEIVGISPALHAVLSRVSKVAPTDSTVLITGETGTGKELVARAIHRRSHRSLRAFVSVNCAAVPRDLIASELFGHEKGAFTGATQRRLGRFELAEGGTIFLDEIGELPAETQIALLRVLQEHEFGRVGGTGSLRTNVRVIAATNRNLEAAIAAGTFRSDLFYRLNVFPIEVPPLRERKEDIPVLVEYFIDRYASKAGKSIRGVNKKSLELLQSYPWPGNIRELQNVIERSVIVCDTEYFSVDESWLSRQPLASEPKTQLELARKPAAKEREIIEAALRDSGGRVYGPSGAASKLGIPRSTLESKIRSLKISKSHFKAIDSPKNS